MRLLLFYSPKRVKYPGKLLAKVIRIEGEKMNVKLIGINFKRCIRYMGTLSMRVGVNCKLSSVRPGSRRRHMGQE